MEYIKDIDKDEMRDGYLVTSHRKKVWNVQCGLIQEFKRICEKYNLKWFADSGTLLGAVRHKGFIPWDDDVDFGMLRPDYEKFIKIAPLEIHEPYYFDTWHKHERPRPSRWDYLQPFAKIRDNRTSMIEWSDATHINQGAWIDIFPFDNAPPFNNPNDEMIFWGRAQLLQTIYNPFMTRYLLEIGEPLPLSKETTIGFLNLPFKEQLAKYEKICEDYFKYEGNILSAFYGVDQNSHLKSFSIHVLDELIEVPFENITLPVPKGFDEYLTASYGDWRTPVVDWNGGHVKFKSADISYKEYFKSCRFPPQMGGGE